MVHTNQMHRGRGSVTQLRPCRFRLVIAKKQLADFFLKKGGNGRQGAGLNFALICEVAACRFVSSRVTRES